MSRSHELSPKQILALPIIAQQPHIEKACSEAGIAKDTYYAWMKEDLFKKELKRLRYDIMNQSVEFLKMASTRAAATLIQLLNEDSPPAVRKQAATEILNYVFKLRDDENLSVNGINFDLF